MGERRVRGTHQAERGEDDLRLQHAVQGVGDALDDEEEHAFALEVAL
jgi:hypothetical protein